MLVNHVTEETDPRKFPAGSLREQAMFIQDPDERRIAAAHKAWRNASGRLLRQALYEDFVDICREAEGDAYYLKPTDEERERELKEKEMEEICLAINSLSNVIATEIKELKEVLSRLESDLDMKMRDMLKEVTEKM